MKMESMFPKNYDPIGDMEKWLGYSIFPPERKLKTRKEFAEYKGTTVEYTKHFYEEGYTSIYLDGLNLKSIKANYRLFNPEEPYSSVEML